MAKSKAQRMKEYRARKKAELGKEWFKRENQRVKGYFVPISELSEEKQAHKRQLNRKHCETYRKKRKIIAHEENTQEVGESSQNIDSLEDENGVSSSTVSTANEQSLTVKMNFGMPKESSRQSRGRKRVSRALAKQYRKNETLQDENESLKRKLNTVRKRLNRLESKQKKAPLTPRSKSDKLLKDAGLEPKHVPDIRKKILFAECLSEEIKEAKKANNQNVVMRVVSGEIIKKYKMKRALGTSTLLDRRRLNSISKSVAHIKKRTRNAMINNTVTREIHEFLSRDDNSRLLPGKADAIKVGAEKAQKRVLNDYMYNLHTKFLAESTYKISLSAFYNKKPRSIAHVNFSSRSVCLCQKHQNFALKLRCLKNYKVTTITSPDRFMQMHNNEELEKTLDKIQDTTVRYQEWKRIKMKDGKQKMRVIDLELPIEEFKAMMKRTYTDMVLAIVEKVIAAGKMYVDNLEAIHFWTDSPTSQYRNKTIFNFISNLEKSHGITGSWQYFESGHGKGPCDGIGGTTKRNADNAVKQGKFIIQDAGDFFKWASQTDSQIEYDKIEQTEFEQSQERVEKENKCIKPIKGTMKIHSVVSIVPGIVRTRETTCVCENCFNENGFVENDKCLWITQNLIKPTPEDQNNQDADVDAEKVIDLPSQTLAADDDVENPENQIIRENLKEKEYVVIVYNDCRYIGQVTEIDDEDDEVEVNCMEECGKVSGRYRWPRNTDKIWLKRNDVLKVIEAPRPTGKTQRIFSVNENTL
ncbi:hypothetical protein MAR_004352 [Mya arenaria]|uniref:Uncharacterized protein n=1 Tax=Mya arenaria TaxID=6604 RepID=A0ABY7EZF4_MYAAR|nr:hypothetical protein MAR_004352 [Mya arenaria]